MPLPYRLHPLTKPTRVLFFGGGQDSTALLYLYVYDRLFHRYYAQDCHFLVIMADTSNEFPATVAHVRDVATWCAGNGIEFHLVRPEMGYHGATWQSLKGQMERNDTIMGVAFPKSCTDQLKIQPAYRFLADWLRASYHFKAVGHRVYYQYKHYYGKLITWIGFAAGEEKRVRQPGVSPHRKVDGTDKNRSEAVSGLFDDCTVPGHDQLPVWRRLCVSHCYPLLDIGLNRQGCQRVIASYGHRVPPPSNCMLCPFQAPAEIVYLYQHYPDEWAYWVERESAKLRKFALNKRNLGVKGGLTLPEYLAKALRTYGTWSKEQLAEYRFSHGHCVMSKI